jgi:hypothetical protein
MNKKASKKRLALSTETVRALTSQHLSTVVGGCFPTPACPPIDSDECLKPFPPR